MRKVTSLISKSYICEQASARSHLETAVVFICHFATLRTRAQWVTGMMALTSALHHGHFHAEVARLVSGLELEDPLPSDPPEGTFSMDPPAAYPDGPAPPPPTNQAGEFDFEESLGAFSRACAGKSAAGIEACIEQASERSGEVAASLWMRYKRSKNTPFFLQVRKIFALFLVNVMLEGDIPKEHPRLYERIIKGTGVETMDGISMFEETIELGIIAYNVIEQCFAERTCGPLFGDSAKIEKMEKEQVFLQTHLQWYMLDTLQRVSEGEGVPCTAAEFEVRAKAQKKAVAAAHAEAKGAAERLVMKQYLLQITSIYGQVVERISRGNMRVVPFAIKLDGTTGIGKSAVTNTLLRNILQIQGENHTDDYIAVINTASNFMDTLTNATRGVIIDDMRNTLVQHTKVDEGRFIIDLLNCMQTPVVKASLEDKGLTFCAATALVVSTNSPDLQASYTSVEPSAILRRFNFHILMEVKPTHALDNGPGTLPMLDGTSMTEGIYTRAHLYTVRQWIPLARTTSQPRDTGYWKVLSKPLEYSHLMQFLQPHILRHKSMQLQMIAELTEAVSHPLCRHGFTTAGHCHMCRDEVPADQVLEDPDEIVEAPPLVDPGLPEHQAGESIRRLFFGAPHPDVQAATAATETCAHNLTACAICHPAEETPPAPIMETVGERMQNTLFPPLPPEAPEPTFIRLIRVMSQGRYKFEDCFVRAPIQTTTLLFGGLPLLGASLVAGLFSLIGIPGIITYLTASAVGLNMVFTVARSSVCWVRGRVAGLTVDELKRRLSVIVQRSMGHTLLAIGLGLSMATLAFAARRLFAKEEEEQAVPPVRLFMLDPHTHAVTPAPANYGAGLAASAPVQPVIAQTSPQLAMPPQSGVVDANGQELCVEHGGCVSVEKPAMPDAVERVDVWQRKDIVVLERPFPPAATMTRTDNINIFTRQLYCVDVVYRTSVVRTYGLMVRTNYLTMPAHNFFAPAGERSIIKELILTKTGSEKGSTFRAKVGASNIFKMPGDSMLIQVNCGGTQRDLVPYFAQERPASAFPVEEYTRNFSSYEIECARYIATPHMVTSPSYGWVYPGFIYNRPQDTYKGLCGALLIAADRHPRIYGMHTMGHEKLGMACSIRRADLESALATAQSVGLVSSPQISPADETIYVPSGMEHAGNVGPLSSRSVLAERPDGVAMDAVGTIVGYQQVKSRSGLGLSPISALVTEQCGMPCTHGPPMSIGKATVEVNRLRELEGLSQMDPDLMQIAKIDRKQELEAIILGLDITDMLRPLTEVEACSGIAGATGVNRLALATAPGYPMTGNKRGLVESAEIEDQPEAIRLTAAQRDEILRVMRIMCEHKRVNFVFKSSHKDEAVKIGKLKCRIFEGAQFTLTYLTRKLFLPIMRVYFQAQLQTSCAVGINAMGPEWSALAEYIMAYNPDEAIEGDWVHFDMSEAYQELMAVFSMWIELAEKHGTYQPWEIAVMWVIAEEISRHYALMRGDVALIDGTNPSGNSLTVFLNNEVNLYRQICAFYALAPADLDHTVPRFRLVGTTLAERRFIVDMRCTFKPLLAHLKGRFNDYVRSTTYGDDFLMAVRPATLTWFNQITISEWFASQGKAMTDSSKNPFTRISTPWNEATFLKRGFRADRDTGFYMAPLVMSSVYKPLHIWPMKLPITAEAHAAELFQNVLRELFQHGREEYEARVPNLLTAARIFDCLDYMPMDPTYNNMRDVWTENAVAHRRKLSAW